MALEDRDTALTTLADVKTYLAITDSSDDTRLSQVIAAASGIISVFCGRKFAQAVYTKYLDGTGNEHLALPHWPITDPLEVDTTYGVWLDSQRTFSDSTKLIQTTVSNAHQDYWLMDGGEEAGQGVLIRTNGTWSNGRQVIKAKWKGGYSTIPGEVAHAARRFVGHLYEIAFRKMHARKREDLGVAGNRIDVFEPVDLPEDIRAILTPWRRAWMR